MINLIIISDQIGEEVDDNYLKLLLREKDRDDEEDFDDLNMSAFDEDQEIDFSKLNEDELQNFKKRRMMDVENANRDFFENTEEKVLKSDDAEVERNVTFYVEENEDQGKCMRRRNRQKCNTTLNTTLNKNSNNINNSSNQRAYKDRK